MLMKLHFSPNFGLTRSQLIISSLLLPAPVCRALMLMSKSNFQPPKLKDKTKWWVVLFLNLWSFAACCDTDRLSRLCKPPLSAGLWLSTALSKCLSSKTLASGRQRRHCCRWVPSWIWTKFSQRTGVWKCELVVVLYLFWSVIGRQYATFVCALMITRRHQSEYENSS